MGVLVTHAQCLALAIHPGLAHSPSPVLIARTAAKGVLCDSHFYKAPRGAATILGSHSPTQMGILKVTLPPGTGRMLPRAALPPAVYSRPP